MVEAGKASTAANKGTCQVLFIRHGERADLAPEKGV